MKGLGPETWIRQKSGDGSAVIRADSAVEGTTTLANVTAFVFDKNDRFLERVEAPEAVLRDGYWEFKDARVLSTVEEPQTYPTYRLASSLEPSQVRQSFTPPESVPFWRLADTIARTGRPGSTRRATGCNTTSCSRARFCSSRWCSWPRRFP